MLAPETIAEIRRLLAEGKLSRREIARRLGVSRGSVGAIALGRRRCSDVAGARENEVEEPSGPPAWCSGCGAMVYMPCVLCHVRSRLRTNPRIVDKNDTRHADESLDLNLRPEHRARYEEVRRWRREQGNISLPCQVEGSRP